MPILESAKLIIDECLFFSKKSKIPLKDKSCCIKKFKKIYELGVIFKKLKIKIAWFNKIRKTNLKNI